ncbi:MAG: glycosyltransferase family 4 protein [Acidobacteria bacterium]|nr:glycosyltransferase family 4 protein [Acidobacteriota bacterium]
MFGLDLLPGRFLHDLAAHHLAAGPDVTAATDLPVPLYAAIFERSVLNILSELPKGVLIPDDPGKVAEILSRAVSQNSHEKGLRLETLSFSQRYGTDRARVAHYIPWASPADLELVEKVLDSPQVGDPMERLALLRDLLVEDLERTHRRRPSKRRPVPRRRRVLYASNPSAYSGSEQSLVNTLHALREADLELHCLVALEGVFTERLRSAGAIVHCPLRDFAQPCVRNLLLIDELLDQAKPDLIHCNAVVGSPLLALSRLRGIPLAQWARTAQLDGLAEHLVCADWITAVSDFLAAEVCKQMVRPAKVRVVHDGVDCDCFSPYTRPPRDVRKELGIAENEFLILCVARFVAYKRHDVLAKAVALASGKHPALHLVLIGEPDPGRGEAYHRCMAELRQGELLARTTTLGFQKDVLSFEAAADAVVLCSEREPLGTVVLESMALGRPIVVAASGGLPEMIQDGVTGLHCAPGSAESLADRLCKLIEEPGLGTTLGQNARQRAVDMFSLEAHGKALAAFYEEALGCGP